MTDILSNPSKRAQRKAQFDDALTAAQELTVMLPATYMAYVTAVALRSGSDMEVCHLAIRELELNESVWWNQVRSRMYPRAR